MTHAEMDGLYELYALGALEPDLAAEIEEHLSQQCPECLARVSEAAQFSAALAGIAEVKKAPAKLRGRVLESIAPAKSSRNWMFAVGGLSAACIALLAFALWSGTRMHRMGAQLVVVSEDRDRLQSTLEAMNRSERNQLADVRSERDQLRSALGVMRSPETRSVRFGTENVPHGWVFANRTGGLVFVGSKLPRIGSDRILELWLMPKSGAPRPAGLFRPNAAGDFIDISPLAVDPSRNKAVAVSIEPREGSSAPTTTPILVVPL